MANVRDSDTSLWLHNKLGISNDSWTGGSICSQLNAEVLRNIKDCFPDLQTQVKLKLLLSFFHIPRRNIDEWRVELDEILEVAQVDSEQWVSMLAESMKTLPASGSLNTSIVEVDENRRIFSDLVNDLRKLVKKHCDLGMLPLECHYLNKTALVSVFGQQPFAVKHFTLKRKPKSAALRAELLQKSVDAASNLKKSAAPTVPVRSRGMPRKMTDTTPLKGIPSRVPSSGFRTPTLTSPLSRPRPPAIRKDGGIKLLDIADQPLGYAQAKKRKRLQEIEEAKRASEAAVSTSPASGSSTPDYAMGLNPATPLSQPVYTPTPSVPLKSTGILLNGGGLPSSSMVAPTTTASASTSTNPVLSCQIQAPITNQIIHIRQSPAQQQKATTSQPNSRPNLSLTRSHMLAAQEMFRTSNKVTRPEKALILGFMAGSRENPCPQLGNIVTIKLSENLETVRHEDDSEYFRLVETHFQMNYNTGEWKKINKYRELDESQVAAIQQQQQQQKVMTPVEAS